MTTTEKKQVFTAWREAARRCEFCFAPIGVDDRECRDAVACDARIRAIGGWLLGYAAVLMRERKSALQKLTREEFLDGYARRSSVSVDWLLRRREAVPCECDYELCDGWQMISKQLLLEASLHPDAYDLPSDQRDVSPRPAPDPIC